MNTTFQKKFKLEPTLELTRALRRYSKLSQEKKQIIVKRVAIFRKYVSKNYRYENFLVNTINEIADMQKKDLKYLEKNDLKPQAFQQYTQYVSPTSPLFKL